jgi:hypothetical protein
MVFWAGEQEKCQTSPLYFLKKYGKIRDKLKGIIPAQAPPHLQVVFWALQKYQLIIIYKARQIYMTWSMGNYGGNQTFFHEGANSVILSKGEIEAGETLDYVRFIHGQLPPLLRPEKGHDQASLLDFPVLNSRIRALPATRDAGIGLGGARLIIADEWEFHEYAPENYAEIKPMIDAGGQMVILSAPNKYNQETKFKEIWGGAREGGGSFYEVIPGVWIQENPGLNNFFPIFLAYNVLPERDEKWYSEREKEYDRWELEGRYPRNEQEALSAPQLVCRFDVPTLNSMRQDLASPIRVERNGMVKIYKEPSTNIRYCLTVDPSEGDYDPSVGMVADWATCEKVAQFSGMISLDEQAQIAFDLYQRYNRPFTAVERNAQGIALVDRLKNLGVDNWYYCDNKREKEGWWTSGQTRPVMITELAEAVRLRQIREPNEESLNQFYSFIRTKKRPDGEARGGAHDEHIFTWAIFLQIRKHLSLYKAQFQTFTRRAY